jgi:hypothetical protein
MTIRIIVHRRMRPSRGHFRYAVSQQIVQMSTSSRRSGTRHTTVHTPATYLSNYLFPMLAFTVVHGIFLAVVIGMLLQKKLGSDAMPNMDHVMIGIVSSIVFMTGDLLIDLPRLRSMPFRAIERMGEISFSRIFVIQITIMGGMFAMAMTNTDRAFFGIFIFLKTMLNFSLYVPQYKPEKPPAWLAGMMDRIGSDKHGGTFTEYWVKQDQDEAARQAKNEQPYDLAAAK